jgi:hypothetical protein
MQHLLRRAGLGALAATLALGVVACGDDDDDAAGTDDTTSTTAAAEDGDATTTTAGGGSDGAGETVEVTAVDYAFEGLPETIAAGSRLSVTNASENNEAHELVAIRIPDDETRPVDELVQLPEAEIDAIFGAAEPATVILTAPGDTDTVLALGDGTISEPGRYAVVCFIPVGADPDEVLNATGPIEGDAPPHAAQGMFAEVTVE